MLKRVMLTTKRDTLVLTPAVLKS